MVVRLFQGTRKYSCNLYCKSRVFSLLNKFVYNSHVARCFWLRSVTEGFCPRPEKFSKCPKTFSFDLPFCLINNFQRKKNWCSETKLWLKVNFSHLCLRILRKETSFWFVHVTDIISYCSVGKNLRKFKVSFSSHKIYLCSESPPFWWGNFEQLCLHLFDRNAAQWRSCFHIWKREAVVKGINLI